MQSLKLAGRLLKREWRAGELRILIFALITAIASTTTIGFFTERLSKAMLSQSAELIGGDLVLKSSRPIDRDWLERGRQLAMDTAELVEFQTVVVHDEDILLTAVKSVSDSYPLRGNLRISDELYGEDYIVDQGPQPGEVWADRRVLNRLGSAVGDSVYVGASSFPITRVLTFEPDRGGDFFNLSPRIMMNLADLPATQVIQPGSRARYSFLYAGERFPELSGWLQPRLGAEHRLDDVKTGRGDASKALNNAERYLRLISLMAIVLAAVAITVATRRYSERHYDVSAMMRCLGATQRVILNIYLWQLALLAVVGGVVGSLLGWAVQAVLVNMLSGMMAGALPDPGFSPIAAGFVTGAIILTGTALPPVLRLKQVSPLRVIRRNLEPLSMGAWLVYLVAAASIFALILVLSNDFALTSMVLVGILVIALLLSLMVYSLIRLGRRYRLNNGSLFNRGIQSLSRRARSSAGQIVAFAVTIMLMVVIGVLRTELLDNWQAQMPEDTPNHFAFNILPADKDPLQQFLADRGVEDQPLYPMVRGRLVSVNGVAVDHASKEERSSDESINRELNLTWTEQLPADNKIIEGQWWRETDRDQPIVSVERELAERLDIHLGDSLSFNIAGRELQVRVHSLRSVTWESFKPNFYMMFPPGVLDDYPTTYITSFRMEGEARQLLAAMVRAFPSVTVLEVEVIIKQIRRILQQVSMAIELMLAFVLLAGFAVLFAAIQSSLDQRLHEGALMRALGARRRYLAMNNIAEFAMLGLASGLLAVIGAELVNIYMYREIFGIEHSAIWWVWLLVPALSAILIAWAGYYSTRRTVTQSPNVMLQQY